MTHSFPTRVSSDRMGGSFDPGFCPGNDRERTRRHRIGNEIFTVEARALKRAEDVPGRDLAMVDRKAGDLRRRLSADQIVKPHDYPPFFSCSTYCIKGRQSASLFSSVTTPRHGPIRLTPFDTIGAAFQARKSVGRGKS